MLNLKECLDKELIRQIPPSMEQASLALMKAGEMLEEARAKGRFNSSVLMAYIAVLNAGRALLFKDGYREKSHYCVARYLEVYYYDKLGPGTIEKLDAYRETRHEVQYSTTHHANKAEAKELVEFAAGFLERIETLLGDQS